MRRKRRHLPKSISWTFEELGRHHDITVETTITLADVSDERGEGLVIDTVEPHWITYGSGRRAKVGSGSCKIYPNLIQRLVEREAEAIADVIIETYSAEEADAEEAAFEASYERKD